MAASSKYLLIQDRLGADLAHLLRQMREAKVSPPAIARLLTLQTGVPISAQGIRYWLAKLDEPNGAAA